MSDVGVSEIRSAAAAAIASYRLAIPLLDVVRVTRAAAESLGPVTAAALDQLDEVWRAAVLDKVAPALAEAVEVMAYVAAVNNGLDPQTVSSGDLARVAEEHLFGVAAYAQLLTAAAYRAAVKTPDVTVGEALAKALDDSRADLLADGLTVHTGNGVMFVVLAVAAPLALAASGRYPLRTRRSVPLSSSWVSDRTAFDELPLRRISANPFQRTKMWISMRDDRVRAAHVAVDGTSVPTSAVFIVGGYSARYPGDPTLPAALRINCRCHLVPGSRSSSGGAAADGPSDPGAADEIGRLIASRRDKVNAARKAAQAAEAARGGPGAGAAAPRVEEKAAEAAGLIAGVIEGSPEARAALEGSGAKDLVPLLLGGSDGLAVSAIIAALIVLYLANDEPPPPVGPDGVPKPVFDAARAHWVATGRRSEFVSSGPDHSDGIMVCVRPTATQVAALVFDGGLPPSEIHCTLAYFGDTAAAEPSLRDSLIEALTDVTQDHGPIEGEVTGVTVFSANDTRPLVALVDAPGLVALRQGIVNALNASALDAMAVNHDFMPHITLAYDATDTLDEIPVADAVVGEPLTFGVVELVFGRESILFELSGGPAPTAEEASAMPATATKTPKIRALELEDGTRFEAVPPDAGTQDAADAPALAAGTFVHVMDTDLVGVVESVATEGAVTDSQGNSLDAAPDAPVMLVTLLEETDAGWADTGVTMVASADQLEAVEDLPMVDGAGSGPPSPEGDGQSSRKPGYAVCPDCGAEVQATAQGMCPECGAKMQAAATAAPAGSRREELMRRAEAGAFDWEAVLIIEGSESGDRRFIEENALTWRELPVPLMLQTTNPETGGHAGAIVAGSIWQIERVAHDIVGRGFFDSGANGQEARRLIDEGTIRGVSADIDMVRSDVMADPEGGDPMLRLAEGRVMGATITPFPAFQEAQIRLMAADLVASAAMWAELDGVEAAAGEEGEPRQVWTATIEFRGGLSVGAVQSLTAAGKPRRTTGVAPVQPPAEWFTKRRYERREPVTVEADGRVYGHVAGWGECHIGFLNQCIMPPKSKAGYGHFYNEDNPLSSFFGKPKGMLTAEGTLVFAGPVFLDLDHSEALTAVGAKDEMAHTGCQVAQVAVYEDEWGIQISGSVDPQATPAQVRVFRASDISPHWTRINGNLELVGMIVVNVSGYPARALVASASGAGSEIVYDGTPYVQWNCDTNEPDVLVAVGMVRKAKSSLEARFEAIEARLDREEASTEFFKVLTVRQRTEHAMQRRETAKALRSGGGDA